MQPIDPADKRQPNVQIAASIRAAILDGELEPGTQLPTGHELAQFFGVSRMTVQTAVRTLREEGFVRSRAGSGVYVRDQANLPAPSEQDQVLSGVATFLFELGHLKHVTRAGWLLLGISQPETVPGTVSAPGPWASHWPPWKVPTPGAPPRCASCMTPTKPGPATSPQWGGPTSPWRFRRP